MTIPWGDIISTGLQLGSAYLGSKKKKKAAQQAAAAATPTPYSTNSMFGTTTVDPKTHQLGFNLAQNPFMQLQNFGGMQSLANAYSAPGSTYYGASPELVDAARGLFGPALDQATQGRLALLNQYAAPGEQRAQNSLLDRLNAMGRLGGTGGQIEQQALYDSQAQAGLQRQMTAADWATNQAMNRFNTAQQAIQSGQTAAQNQFTMGTQSQNNILDYMRTLLAQANTGVASGGGTPVSAAQGVADASMAWPNALAQFGQSSGAFGAIGNWLGGMLGGSGSTTPTATTGTKVIEPIVGAPTFGA
jgi:hypothetical protein